MVRLTSDLGAAVKSRAVQSPRLLLNLLSRDLPRRTFSVHHVNPVDHVNPFDARSRA